MPKEKKSEKKSAKKQGSKASKKEEEKEEKREEIIEKINENLDKEEKKEEKETPPKSQIKSEKKMFAIFLGILVLIAAVFAAYLILSRASTNFTYNGVQYTIVKKGDLTFYDTKIPIIVNGTPVQYNVFIRNDPRVLEKQVPFNGTMYIRPYIAINYTTDLYCNGDEIISLANMNLLYSAIGSQVALINSTTYPNATCDPQGRYVFVNIQQANETGVQEIGPACYNIYVSNCQILQGTERFMVQTFETLSNYTKSTGQVPVI